MFTSARACDVMDLSLKKQDIQVPQDLPQDLSLKKPRSSGSSGHQASPQSLFPLHIEKPKVTSHSVKTSSLFGHSPEMVPALMDHKSRIMPSLIEPKSRIIPDLDQYIRAMMDLKPIFSDQHVKAFAHQNTKTLSSQSRKTAADIRCASLVVPKRSALVIPDPRNRTLPDQRAKHQETQSHSLPEKLKSFSPVVSHDAQLKQVLDFSKRKHSAHTITEQLLSHDLHRNDYSDRDSVRSLPPQSLHQSTASSGAVPVVKEDTNTFLQTSTKYGESLSPVPLMKENRDVSSCKRRRKQECPRKRVKVDCLPPEEEEEEEEEVVEDTVFNISEEMLDKVTDAAQNGELHKGLDEYFAQTTKQVAEVNNKLVDAEVESVERAVDEPFKECEDSVEQDGSTSPSSSVDGLSPFQFPSASPPKQKVKQARMSASLQNREERKALRLYGKEYTTPSGKTYPQRQVRNKDCSRCRYNCSSGISPEQRQALFDHFWSLDSYVKRLYYYCQSIKEKPAKTMKHTRECSREYTFLVDGERVRVCKGFYLATLDVSDKAVRIAMEKRKRGKGMWDKRGAHPPQAKARPEDKDRVRSHIESVLIMDIYSKTGDGSPSAIPGQDLNLSQMHQDYVQGCQEDGKDPVTEDAYRNTFNTEYNLSTVQV